MRFFDAQSELDIPTADNGCSNEYGNCRISGWTTALE